MPATIKRAGWRAGLSALGLVLAMAPALSQTASKTTPEFIRAATAKVDGASIVANERATRDWPSYGLDYAETRYSKLKQIDTANVGKLGLVWSYNLESTRGVEATPVVIDGVMYVTASWSVVHAVDVRTGQRLWIFDPKVDRSRRLQGLLRRGQSRRGGVEGQGLRRLLRRPADRAGCGHRRQGLGEGHDHRPQDRPTPSPARRASSRAR